MEVFHWKEYWDILKPSLRKAHPHLTAEDLEYIKGQEKELMNRLSYILGKSTIEINELLFIHLISLEDHEDEEKKIPRMVDQVKDDLVNSKLSGRGQASTW